MNDELCDFGHPVKLIPAGVSRTTGRPYDAFKACSERSCKWKPARPAMATPFIKPGQVQKAKEVMTFKGEQIRVAQDNKNDSIRLSGASRDATLILTTFYPEASELPVEEREAYLKDRWLYWKNYFYNRSAETPQPDTKPF